MKTPTTEMTGLEMFAAAVVEAAKRAADADPSLKFGRSKVFIAALQPSKATVRLLIEAHRAGLLELSRADLTPAMRDDLVRDSEISYMHAVFHFVRI